MPYDPKWALKWSLAGSGLGTTIAASGNSPAPSATPPADYSTGAIDLGQVTDVGLYVYAAAKSGSPSVTVSLWAFSEGGNLFGPLLTTAAITASGSATPVCGGLHGPSGSYFVLPHWGQIQWAYTGTGNLSGVEISLYGR